MRILISLMTALLVSVSIIPSAYAQILPRAPENCEDPEASGKPEAKFKEAFEGIENFKAAIKKVNANGNGATISREDVLGCAIKLGRVKLFMMPIIVTYLAQFLLEIAGLIAVLFMVIGGYRYVIGGITEDKDSGKKTITHALIGLLVALSAWIVVNFVQVALTS